MTRRRIFGSGCTRRAIATASGFATTTWPGSTAPEVVLETNGAFQTDDVEPADDLPPVEDTTVLVLACRSTPPEYLAYLRRSEIAHRVAGDDDVDLAAVIVPVADRLGVTRVVAKTAGGLTARSCATASSTRYRWRSRSRSRSTANSERARGSTVHPATTGNYCTRSGCWRRLSRRILSGGCATTATDARCS